MIGVTRNAQDDALVECACHGDVEAFSALYERYKADVWHTATFTLRDHHEAEDAFQETFLKAFRALDQWHGDALRPWLLTICRNLCMDRLRARPRDATVSLQDDDVAEPASPVEDQDRRIDFHRALEELSFDDREAFFLVDVMGCHSDEAARIVGLRAPSTLRSRVARARRHLAPAVTDLAPAVDGDRPPLRLLHDDQPPPLTIRA